MPESSPADRPEIRKPPPPAPSKGRALLCRSVSTVVLVALLALAFWLAKPWIYLAVFALLSLGALTEYFRLFAGRGFRSFRGPVYLVSVAYLVLGFAPLLGFDAPEIGPLDGLALAALLLLIVVSRIRAPLDGFRSLDEIAAAIFGFAYCVVLFSLAPKILLLPLETASGQPANTWYLIHLIAVTKLTDAGAYLVGSAIGKDKLVPQISPGKTWQGFWGALVFAVGGSYLIWWLLGDRIPLVGPLSAGLLALALALAAVLGDLAESIIKRSLAVKDSGHVMPGIGGFLDLVDSIIFTAPLYYLYLRLAA